MKTTGHRFWALLAVKAVTCACEWFITRTKRPWRHMCIVSPAREPASTATNGEDMRDWSGLMKQCITGNANGRGMGTGTAAEKYIFTQPKACGPMCVLSCDLSKVCIKSISPAMWRWPSSAAISSASRQPSSLPSSTLNVHIFRR